MLSSPSPFGKRKGYFLWVGLGGVLRLLALNGLGLGLAVGAWGKFSPSSGP